MSTTTSLAKRILLVLGDAAILYGALYATLVLRFGDAALSAWPQHLMLFTIIFAAWVLIFYSYELYDLTTSYNTSNLLSTVVRVMIINSIVAIVLLYTIAPLISTIRPQRVLAIDIVITAIAIFLWRKIFFRYIQARTASNKVLIIGTEPLAQELFQEITRRPQLSFEATQLDSLPTNIEGHCKTKGIKIIAIDPAAFRNPEISKELFRCLPLGVTIITIPNLYEQVTIKIPVEHIEWEWFLSNLNEHSKRTYELSKRALDIIIALIGLSISIVVAPLVALAIKLTSPGPVIFKQVRTGQGGVPFVAMKFRSMRTDAEASGPQWAQKTDPRITPFGRFMRKTRLDEIPQLINVLRGELSIVGPRPERPEFIELLTKEIPFYQQRLLVKPGLTGWAQLNGPAYGGSVPESLEKVKYDLYYIKHRSLILDLTVILKTIKTVISAKGQ